MGRAPCCDKANVKKGPWSPEEDDKLKDYIEHHGTGGNWIALPQKIGLKRCGKSCRLRWLNYLRQGIKHGGFSEEEENIICSLYISIGSRWSIIAAQLPGRTDNDIKNYWNTRLKKKLLGKQRKHQAAAAARNNRVKQQEIMNKVITNSADQGNNHHHYFMAASTATNSYSPMPPLPISAPQYLNHQDHLSLMNTNNHADPLKNLLLKLGGRFSYDHDHGKHNLIHSPTVMDAPSATQPQIYDNSINFSVHSTTTPASIVMSSSLNDIINSSTSYSQLLQTSCNSYDIDGAAANLNMLQAVLSDGFPLDADDMVYNNYPQRFEGSESCYGVDMAGNGSSTGTSSSSAESTCSLFDMGYPSLITNSFEGCEQGLQKECNNFENSSYQQLA